MSTYTSQCPLTILIINSPVFSMFAIGIGVSPISAKSFSLGQPHFISSINLEGANLIRETLFLVGFSIYSMYTTKKIFT